MTVNLSYTERQQLCPDNTFEEDMNYLSNEIKMIPAITSPKDCQYTCWGLEIGA